MLGVLISVVLGASDVAVTVAPGVVCVERARLVTRLEQGGLRVTDRSERLAVSIELVGAKVRVRGLKRGGAVLERSVQAKVDDCAAIERVIVALITSWSQTLIPAVPAPPAEKVAVRVDQEDEGKTSLVTPAVAPAPPASTVARSDGSATETASALTPTEPARPSTETTSPVAPPPERPPTETASPLSAGREEVARPSAETASPVSTDAEVVRAPTKAAGGEEVARPPTETTSPLSAAAGAPQPSTEATSPLSAAAGATQPAAEATSTLAAGKEGAPSTTVALEIGAFGGTSIGPTTSFTGRGQASVGLAFHRFGIALDAGFDSARSRTVGNVTVESTSQWGSLHGFLYFHPLDRLRLELSLGVRVFRLAAEATGADDNGTAEVASFGPIGGGHLTFRLIGPLSFHLNLFTSARYRAERFNVTNLGAVLELLPWEFGVLGGLQLDAAL